MRSQISVVAVVVGLLASGCKDADRSGNPAPSPEALRAGGQTGFPDWALGLFGALPETTDPKESATAKAKVSLGRALYYETLLSNGRNVSCNSCHPLTSWGTTSRAVPAGESPRASKLDVPSVYNAAVEVDLYWDGRAHSVEEQARGSILSPFEMAMPDEAAVLDRLRAVAKYTNGFRAAFPSEHEPLTFANVASALAAFERRLVTPSRWDKFLRGDGSALTAEEKKGFETFVARGCSDCHNGVAVGGRMYQMVGQVKPWPLQSDSGRYGASRKQEDLFVFRVPQLRNIEMTGPYFDTGVVNDLSEAVRLMARYQRGMNLSDSDVAAIVSWLGALTGKVPEDVAPSPTW
jgi:cytochrome c peroxidase